MNIEKNDVLEEVKKDLENIKMKAQIHASHCAVQKDRYGNVDSTIAFEKVQEIYELIDKTLKKIGSEK